MQQLMEDRRYTALADPGIVLDDIEEEEARIDQFIAAVRSPQCVWLPLHGWLFWS